MIYWFLKKGIYKILSTTIKCLCVAWNVTLDNFNNLILNNGFYYMWWIMILTMSEKDRGRMQGEDRSCSFDSPEYHISVVFHIRNKSFYREYFIMLGSSGVWIDSLCCFNNMRLFWWHGTKDLKKDWHSIQMTNDGPIHWLNYQW